MTSSTGLMQLLCVTAACLLLFVSASSNVAAEQGGNPIVVIETSMGDVTIELNKDKAPVTVENFLAYVKAGYYKGTIFHRVIKGFMIQGGGFGLDMQRKATRPPIVNEAKNGLNNARGTIAMARTADPDSATSQFFINTVNNQSLDYSPANPGYAVFGKVTAGMDVVEKIEAGPTGAKAPFQKDVPLKTVLIKDIRVKS
jgi:peptidyl-prolyl cis-trans isomerase A (cyclophilin A)